MNRQLLNFHADNPRAFGISIFPPSGGGSLLLRIFVLCTAASLSLAAMSVSLTPSLQSPAPLGTAITWTSTVSAAAPGTLSYAFRVQTLNGPFHTIVDFGPNSSVVWTSIEPEGAYTMEALVKNGTTGEETVAAYTFTFSSLVTAGVPVI